ncbi:M24 family metallopeptidase [Thalassotalea sp. LPB0316]|uniref:M24 family metallopeptidase n=1 Tax=Thalassotalea sp. LPB0316 TaxID=2769490 RepID=UPI0018689CF9|nr:M24 family metallopeptidase [Thalassotalea sp. LPB0316]QOL25405.1 M24 family metallopeptidase [Thalassotalea sp. LPB0316]
MSKIIATSLFIFAFSVPALADWQPLPLRERAQVIDSITEQRITTLLPRLMKQHGVDMWLIISREYNEDPIIKTMLPATWHSARRRTILAFINTPEEGLKALAIAPYKVGIVFERAWDKKNQPNQWQALNDVINLYKPRNIALNESEYWGHADGLNVTDKRELIDALPKAYHHKLVSAEPLAIAWLETRIEPELEIMEQLVAQAHAIIAEGFSSKTIEVGKTTTEDMQWWFREKVLSLNLQTWFHPTVAIQRSDAAKFDHEDSFTNGYGEQVIQAGDLLHVDFGLSYLRLNTDTQQHAYVLKQGERQAPNYLVNALQKANLLQDIFTQEFAEGRTGNQVLKSSLNKAKAKGLKPTIYTHPLGYHGHGAGTTIGMWDQQNGVVGTGDYPLHYQTAYSIELNNAVYLNAWQKEIRIMLEENAYFDESGIRYFDGRQTELLLIENN